jgi:hypothetical protein
MRARAFMLPVLACGAVAACGGGGGGGSDGDGEQPPAEDSVRSALTAYRDATAARDAQRLCTRLLARALVTRIERAGLPCQEALRIALEDVRDPVLEVQSVRVRGTTAEARVRSGAAGQEPSTDTVRLVQEDGTWRITSLTESR